MAPFGLNLTPHPVFGTLFKKMEFLSDRKIPSHQILKKQTGGLLQANMFTVGSVKEFCWINKSFQKEIREQEPDLRLPVKVSTK